ncbi:MAG: hypothetical protein ACI9OJ_000756 [Myxococcota bacterium]|jgi:hypothetical protein
MSLNRAQPLRIVRLKGSQQDMGYQHGRLVREYGGLDDLMSFYRKLPENILFGGDSLGMLTPVIRTLARPLLNAGLARLSSKRPTALGERSRAFMTGAGRSPSDDRFILVMDLMQNVVGTVARMGVGPFAGQAVHRAVPACTTAMVWGDSTVDGEVRHARNFDLPGIGVWDTAPTVVFCTPDSGVRYGFVTTFGADAPGISAFNEAGLTITMHTRFHEQVSFDGIGVVDLGHEIARRAETLNDAVRIARERPAASSWGIAISSVHDRRGIVLETNSAGVWSVEPQDGQHWLGCTNRYRHSATMAGQVSSGPGWAEHSDGREARLAEVIEGSNGMSTADLEALLGDHVDPTGGRCAGGSTIAQPISITSMVSEPEQRRLRLSVGSAPTGWGPYATIDWDWDGPELEICETEPDSVQDGHYLTGPGAAGYRRLIAAHQAEMATHDDLAILAELEAARVADPAEPTYAFLAGAYRLRTGDFETALAHFQSGLETERAPFRRANLLLWGSRTADALGLSEEAERLRAAIYSLHHPHIGMHRNQATAEASEPYPKRRLRAVSVNLVLVDII